MTKLNVKTNAMSAMGDRRIDKDTNIKWKDTPFSLK